MTTSNAALRRWVDEVAALTKPAAVRWCDGSDAEYQQLLDQVVASVDLLPLNPATHPNCYLHRSDPSDVARVEHLTFVCTPTRDAAGPNNNWMSPEEAHAQMNGLFAGAMQGRTLYVVPYCMGPIDSPYARCGVEITDSAYVAANMRLMTRMGTAALKRIEGEFRRSKIVEQRWARLRHREGALAEYIASLRDEGLLIDEIVLGVAGPDPDAGGEITVPIQVHAIRAV